VTGKLGAGGMATVYQARHLMSGTTRALKVSRADSRAEEALVAEHQALTALKAPESAHIVSAIDITGIVAGRKTLVLERLRGMTLAARIGSGPALTDEERRVFAENLFSALIFLEQKEVVHKDIKPDNLIVSGDDLTLIDFSLAGLAPKDTAIGTALYRDPALSLWSAVNDRYAAALCLFEMYVGRHAFGGRAPSPEDVLIVDDQELDRPALAEFFRKALSRYPNHRHPSAVAMRAAMQDALGSKSVTSVPPPSTVVGIRAGDAPL
jgi:serine/threonine protein kinase